MTAKKKKEELDAIVKGVAKGETLSPEKAAEVAAKELEKAKREAQRKMEAAVASLNNQYAKKGSGSEIVKASSIRKAEPIPTGFEQVDKAIGIGGMPDSGVVEIYGPESSGKSYLAQHVVGAAQKLKPAKYCLYCDLEGSLQPDRMAKIGVNVDELYIIDPDQAEIVVEKAEALMEKDLISVVVFDSTAALQPKLLDEADLSDSVYAAVARFMSRALPKLTLLAKKHNVLVIFINQLRTKIGATGYQNPEDTPGGKALKYYAHLRMEVKPYYSKVPVNGKKIGPKITNADGSKYIGQRCNVKVTKNKFAPPFEEGMFELYYAEPDVIREMVMKAKKAGLWFVRKDVYKYKSFDGKEEVVGQGEDDFVRQLVLQDKIVEMAQRIILWQAENGDKPDFEELIPEDFDIEKLEAICQDEKMKYLVVPEEEEEFNEDNDVLPLISDIEG